MAAADTTITAVVAMTRCSAFNPKSLSETTWDNVYGDVTAKSSSCDPEYEVYAKSLTDPTVYFHASAGAELLCCCRNYRPEDYENR